MDPVTVSIVGALVAGATAATKDVATDAIKDAYAALKRMVADRYQKARPAVDALLADPRSTAAQAAVSSELASVDVDPAVKTKAAELLEALEALRGEPRAEALFDFRKLRALRNFEVSDIETFGPVLSADEAVFEGDFVARNIRQRGPEKN